MTAPTRLLILGFVWMAVFNLLRWMAAKDEARAFKTSVVSELVGASWLTAKTHRALWLKRIAVVWLVVFGVVFWSVAGWLASGDGIPR